MSSQVKILHFRGHTLAVCGHTWLPTAKQVFEGKSKLDKLI